MKPGQKRRDAGPSQRQLRAGELVRHALVEILREETLNDGALENASVTVTEVRMSPDLRHAQVFVEPLGGVGVRAVTEGLNRAARFLRGRLGRHIELKFTPDLHFVHDASFEEADRMERLIAAARRADDARHEDDQDTEGDEPAGSVRVFTPASQAGQQQAVPSSSSPGLVPGAQGADVGKESSERSTSTSTRSSLDARNKSGQGEPEGQAGT